MFIVDKVYKGVGIFFIFDVIGIWKNSKLIVDQFVVNGYLILLIDVFNGDVLFLNCLGFFDFNVWLIKGFDGNNFYIKEVVDFIVEDVIKVFKEEYGVEKLGVVGYCFGVKVDLFILFEIMLVVCGVLICGMQYVVRYYKDGIKVGYVVYFLFVEEDELVVIQGFFSIVVVEIDFIFFVEKCYRSEEIL